MRLVFLSHDSNCIGGAQKCLLDLLKGIKTIYPDWQIYMVFPSQGDFVNTCLPYLEGYKVIRMKWWLIGEKKRLKRVKRLSYLYKMFKEWVKLLRYLLQIRPNLGITNTIVIPHLALSCKFLKIKHCWFIHEIPNTTWGENHFIFKHQIIFRLVDKLSTIILVTSEYANRYYQKVISNDKLNTITQAVELSSPIDLMGNREIHDRYTILLVGAFDSNKGQLELLQAVKKIVDEGRDIYCYLVGPDIGFMSMCKDAVVNDNLNNYVEIVPFVEQIYQYYYKADVLLVCSKLETFGRVAVEAQLCEMPVILSNVGANPERIRNGVDGLLYQRGDIDDLVAKIEIMRDTEIRKKYSACIDSVALKQKCSVENFALQFSRLLNISM